MITQEKLKELFHYNHLTGEFIRLKNMSNKNKAGEVIFGNLKTDGYRVIKIEYKLYYAHRLAYLYMKGVMPTNIDHIDGNKSNNIWDNLREVTHTENMWNRKVNTNSATGIKGIFHTPTTRKPALIASTTYKGKIYKKNFTISKFNSYDAALVAATTWLKDTRQQLHGEFTNHG